MQLLIQGAITPREPPEEDEVQVELGRRRPNPDASRSRASREPRHFQRAQAPGSYSHRGKSSRHTGAGAKTGESLHRSEPKPF